MMVIPAKVKGGYTYALVDNDNYDALRQFRWHRDASGYIVRGTKPAGERYRTVYMHREVINAQRGQKVDHHSGDRQDNQRSNLRLATSAQNNANREARATHGGIPTASRYKGVHYDSRKNNPWYAKIGVQSRQIFLGSFSTELEAAIAYNDAALAHYGEFARVNNLELGAA